MAAAITATVTVNIKTDQGKDVSASATIDACYQLNSKTSDFLPGDIVIISVSKPPDVALNINTTPTVSVISQGTVDKPKRELLKFFDPQNFDQSVSDPIKGTPTIEVFSGGTIANVTYNPEYGVFTATSISTMPPMGIAKVEYVTEYTQYQLTVPATLDDNTKKYGIDITFWAIVPDEDDECG